MQIESILMLITGIVIGAFGMWLLVREKIASAGATVRTELEPQLATVHAALASAKGENVRLDQEKAALQQRADSLDQLRESFAHAKIQAETSLEAERTSSADLNSRLATLITEHNEMRTERDRLATEKTHLDTQLKSDRANFAEKFELLEKAKIALSDQFKVLANEIFEEKSKQFTEMNQDKLGALLTPLGVKLKEFETKVQVVYDNESQQRSALKAEILKLVEANAKISTDANNLANALKGGRKTQGAWGEMILERLLEASGLSKDREYRVQQHYRDEEGSGQRPDVIIDLPEKKHVIVDSKVSLSAYERFHSTDDETERTGFLAQHVAAMKNHVIGLSGKNYQKLYELKSLDFVLMFVPIESAFFAAVQADPSMFQEALSKNVMIVCPSILLGTLRIIANIWRYEYQNRNALEIARQASALYDKFVGFVTDLEEVGDRLDKARGAYDAAYNKLVNGRGNLITSTEKLRKLGVKPTKELPYNMVEAAQDSDLKMEISPP